jgi:hypothetical protein
LDLLHLASHFPTLLWLDFNRKKHIHFSTRHLNTLELPVQVVFDISD